MFSMKRLLPWICMCVVAAGLPGDAAAEADDQPTTTGTAEPGFQTIFNGSEFEDSRVERTQVAPLQRTTICHADY
jgi:hypothetical protein